jgi:hypothetical protein
MIDNHPIGHPASLEDLQGLSERNNVIAALDRFIVKHYGERCSDPQGGCPTCSVWAARDALNATILE